MDRSFCRNDYQMFTAWTDSPENLLQLEKPMQVPLPTDNASTLSPARSAQLMKKARELEANFLSEMLSHTGLDAQTGAFTGGAGEDQFASFLRDAQAKAMVAHGGIGLSQSIFNALARRDHAGS
jgi:Rod binding domain-containing protein